MAGFDLFVLLAGMRTGSNALEEAINLYPGLACYGEAFNPGFIGHQGVTERFGFDLARRERAPLDMIEAMRAQTEGLPGFRLFHDHDPRVLSALLPDPRVAKIVLTRDPAEAYVSLKIARATGQWKLTDAKDRKVARPRFEPDEFATFAAEQARFYAEIRRICQETGQAPFPIDHAEIGEVAVVNGLVRYLGVEARLERLTGRLKRQNPEPLDQRVDNPDEMRAALGRSAVASEPNQTPLEPERGPAVRGWYVAEGGPLIYVPLAGGPHAAILDWIADFGGEVTRGYSQKDLRRWRNGHKGARVFAVVSHPVLRLYRVFRDNILPPDVDGYGGLCAALRNRYGVPLPEGAPPADWPEADERAAFLGFLRVAAASNAGQTSLRADPAWATQAALLAGAARLFPPDLVIREADLAGGLAEIARQIGRPTPPSPKPDTHGRLAALYTEEVEAAARELHRRDYVAFGFQRWRPGL